MTETHSYQRLYVDAPLADDILYACTKEQAHYLLHVLRLGEGAGVLVFNGIDGEWRAEVRPLSKKACQLALLEQVRPQSEGPRIRYLFAPLKRARLDYMVQKATELGVMSVQPVITRRTNVARVNESRLQANLIEAAEQCGVLRLPQLKPVSKLEKCLDSWDTTIPLIFCDEAAPIGSPLAALEQLPVGGEVAVLIGPEGGFDDSERQHLLSLPCVYPISLGPRIMRADTAAVAALSLVNAVLFDWR